MSRPAPGRELDWLVVTLDAVLRIVVRIEVTTLELAAAIAELAAKEAQGVLEDAPARGDEGNVLA